MTLIDTGPLVALLDRGEADHVRVAKTLGVLPGRLVTTWPVLTEAMYLMHRAGGWAGQHHLWALVLSERLEVVDLKEVVPRMHVLMAKYQDTPMGLADGSLVAAAEFTGCHRVFTLDSDFGVYRIHDPAAFDLV
ncbi:MAG: PIN domain-containing protein [Thermaerobacter sp.]|nr:PIN domain-containing protein [Thermaerobacter sp.]